MIKNFSLRSFIGSLLILTLCSVAGMLFFVADHFWSRDIELNPKNSCIPSILLDDEGNQWAIFQREQCSPVALKQLPNHLIQAFIAAEDRQFFNHQGISYKGIVRSLLINLYHGRFVQGASTITQQLVRLLFFDTHKTVLRKIKEQIVALLIEQRFTKEQILEAYLNNVYFGCGIYGVEAACQRFWGKPITHCTLDEAASLAAVMRSPGNYCPLLCPLSCQRRRNTILRSMQELCSITQKEYETARKEPLHLQEQIESYGLHLKEYIRQQLEQQFGKQLIYGGGLSIQTTVNIRLQKIAEEQFKKQCAHLRTTLSPTVDGGLVSIEVTTGAIKALIGGFNFRMSQFNRATQARRQMGSIFKPLLYAQAIQHGMMFNQVMIDEPLELIVNGKSWHPKNNDSIFHGQMTLAYALSHSTNTIAIKMLLSVGIPNVIQLAKTCGLQGPFKSYPSLALGCVEASVLEAVGMFNIFAHHGIYVEPHAIRWVKNHKGEKIWRANPARRTVLDPLVSDQVAQVLMHWPQRIKRLLPQPWIESDALCKTGTTNDSRTCWFIGATPRLTTGMYIGCDDNSSLGNNIYPLRVAFPIWMSYNRQAEHVKEEFIFDTYLKKITVHELTGEPIDKSETHAITLALPNNALLQQ